MNQDQKRPTRGLVAAALAVLAIGVIWLVNTPAGLLGKADAVGYAVCHRIPAHGFFIGERAFPMCARCSGMFLGALITQAYYLLRRPRAGLYPRKAVVAVLILFFLFWAGDGLNSTLAGLPEAANLYPPSNTLRAISGALMGITLTTMVYPAFIQSAWADWASERGLAWRDLLTLIGAQALMVLALHSDAPALLYPLALLSAAGVLTTLAMAYTMLLIVSFKREGRSRSWRELAPMLLLGFTCALLQIALLDWLRYGAIGAW
ncbi:MAG: DUF2085 domain-containing protein [Anaerolineales bacterium]|nr:DUF2085 domain-containing protein [Anaerolineales bacterium]